MKLFAKSRLKKMNDELQTLKKDFIRIQTDLQGMSNLIEDPKQQNYIQIHVKVFHNLSNSLYKNKLRQDKLKQKISKLS